MATDASPVAEKNSKVFPHGNPYLNLFLISFLILFFELTCIRWFGSMVIFLTFFTNLVLMACFLGISVGCVAARLPKDLVDRTIPLAVWSVLLSCAILLFYSAFGRILVDVGSQGSPQQVFFGTEYLPKDPSYFVVPIEVLAGVFFVLIACMFAGLGQEMGRALDRISNHVVAYTTNILGSLAGIVAFGVASLLHTPPIVWFAVAIGLCLYFVKRSRLLHTAGLAGILVLVGAKGGVGLNRGDVSTHWSPYYRVDYSREFGAIFTNNIGHQSMLRISEAAPAYMLPYLLNRGSGQAPFDEVLVVGAGSGNDVQAALSQGAKHVDAVEIDPVINRIGREDHPDHPYSDPRVSVQIDDGRSFVRNTSSAYDLVSYAVVDSLVLHSGYSSLRLESFLFTEQAFRDIKSRLKPGGVFAMYNFYRQGWVVGRLAKLAEKVFGTAPLVISLPYQETISPGQSQGNHFTLLLAGGPDCRSIEAIQSRFAENQSFWVNDKPKYNQSVDAFGPEPPKLVDAEAGGWQKIGLAHVDTTGIDVLPSDDWPFLYLREPTIPGLNLRWIGMVAVLSLVVLFWQAPVRSFAPNGQMFFLGAGFMLLETKGVVQMALLFGSTWMVNSIIFFAILVMILLSNLFVILTRPRKQWPYYGLLIASLAVNALVPMNSYLGLSWWVRSIVSCSLVFVPVFFAGIIFAMAFRDSDQPDVDMGSNIGGVILGGLSESFSLIGGFNSLLFLASAYYVLSSLFARKRAR
jgi:spermidine synthase